MAESTRLAYSPSSSTLLRLERESIVLWRQPVKTVLYASLEAYHLLAALVLRVANCKLLIFLLSVLSAIAYYLYITPGAHQEYVQRAEQTLVWWSWWLCLGVLSSIGFGTGLHTFLLYLGPHIAAVTLAAYECASVDFPEPPYPDSIVCPAAAQTTDISIWAIVSKVRVEALLWGVGTAIGELPPYFMARAARITGLEVDDEDYKKFKQLTSERAGQALSFADKCKRCVEAVVAGAGFPGILLFASIPNPLFDLAGFTCGHFLTPFWSFFGATLIGKAVVKTHVQMLFVIVAFSERHVDAVLRALARLPSLGELLRTPIKAFLEQQRVALHRAPGGAHFDPQPTLVQTLLSCTVTAMVAFFCLSILNVLAQNYHRRTHP